MRSAPPRRTASSMSPVEWQFEWVEQGVANAPQELLRAWTAAAEDHGNIWQVPELVYSWEQTVACATGRTPHLLVARNGSGQAVIYPLYSRREAIRRLPRVVIEPLGAEMQFDYQDPVEVGKPLDALQRKRFWKQLPRELGKKFGFRYEFRAYRFSDTSRDLPEEATQCSTAPYIDLSGIASLRDFLSTRSKKLRDHVNRGLRHLRNLGCTSIARIDDSDVPRHFMRFCEIYERQWGRDGHPHALQHPEIRASWELLSEKAAALKKLHFSVLAAGGEPWSYHMGFEHRGVLLWYKPTYNIDHEEYSPGSLHLALTIQDCIERGVRCLDLGWGAEPYKFRWADQERPLYSLQIQSWICAVNGHLHSTAGALRRNAKLQLSIHGKHAISEAAGND